MEMIKAIGFPKKETPESISMLRNAAQVIDMLLDMVECSCEPISYGGSKCPAHEHLSKIKKFLKKEGSQNEEKEEAPKYTGHTWKKSET